MFFCGIVLADSRFCGRESRSFPEKCGVVIFRGTQIIFLGIMRERRIQNNGFGFPLFFMKDIKKQEIKYGMKEQQKKKFVDCELSVIELCDDVIGTSGTADLATSAALPADEEFADEWNSVY
jgi:hypothetical protein